jgi:hypothetical protein
MAWDPLDSAKEIEQTMRTATPEDRRKYRRAFFGGMLGMAGVFLLIYLVLEAGKY